MSNILNILKTGWKWVVVAWNVYKVWRGWRKAQEARGRVNVKRWKEELIKERARYDAHMAACEYARNTDQPFEERRDRILREGRNGGDGTDEG